MLTDIRTIEAIKADPLYDEGDTHHVDLNTYDDEGDKVDGDSFEMQDEHVSQVVDFAAEMLIIRRAGGDITPYLDALDELLTVSGVLGEVPKAEQTPTV